jgi:hypothetical protein
MDTVVEHGRRRRVRGLVDDAAPYRYEAELEEFLRSRGRRDPDQPAATTTNGRAPAPRRRRSRSTTT